MCLKRDKYGKPDKPKARLSLLDIWSFISDSCMQIEHYLTADGRDVFQSWLEALRDQKGRIAIQRRVDRIECDGHFGDRKVLEDGVCELRLDVGPGYRVYYAQDGQTVVLLLCGGDKSTQARDIKWAVGHWKDYQQRRRR
jgi:putative addiction module killer protein